MASLPGGGQPPSPPPSRRGCPAGVEAPRLRPAALPQPGVPAAVRRDGARDVQGRGGPGPRRGRLPPGGRPAAGRAPSPPRPGCFACFRSWMLALSVSRREAGNAERPLWGPFSTAYYEVVQRSGGGVNHPPHLPFFPLQLSQELSSGWFFAKFGLIQSCHSSIPLTTYLPNLGFWLPR